MRCPRCRQDNPSRAKFCLECGERLPSGCPACGHALPESAKFCMECGAPVHGPAAAPEPAAHEPAAYTPRHLAEKVLASRSAIEGERKPVTVLFCDAAAERQEALAVIERVAADLPEDLARGFVGTAAMREARGEVS